MAATGGLTFIAPPSDWDKTRSPFGSPYSSLQESLKRRSRGGPLEHVQSNPQRLRSTRSSPIQHSSIEEPLSQWKSLEPLSAAWPSSFRRFHSAHGIRVLDNDTVVAEARDKVVQTVHGPSRSSTGTVTYSNTHRLKMELDVGKLAEIVASGVPGGMRAWTPERLETMFQERTGRPGCWKHYDIGIEPFLMLFPRTFELFGNGKYVRLRVSGKGARVLDPIDDVLVRLARARFAGDQLSPSLSASLTGSKSASVLGGSSLHGGFSGPLRDSLPQLQNSRMKVAYAPRRDPFEL